jgi:prepilin-type processing-associated H-X9-DG protein
MERARRNAFTLIEVLVIVSVVAVVTAIVYPAVSRARQKARLTRCVSNLHQVALAVLAYTADYDETYPLARFKAESIYGSWVEVRTWKRVVRPYLEDASALRCPSVENEWPPCPDLPGAFGDASNIGPEYRGDILRASWLPASYALSGGFFSARPFHGIATPRRTTELQRPGDVILIVSSRMGGSELGPEAMLQHGVNPHTGSPDARFWNRFGPFPAHLGRIPFAMADGHVEALKLMETVAPRDRWHSRRPEWSAGTPAGRRSLVAAAAEAQNDVTEYH